MSKAVAKKAGFDDAVPDKATKADIVQACELSGQRDRERRFVRGRAKISLSQRGRVTPVYGAVDGKPIEDAARAYCRRDSVSLFELGYE